MKFFISKKIKRLSIATLALVGTSATFIPFLTSCSHVYTEQFIRDNATVINLSKSYMVGRGKIDSTLSDQEIIDNFWNDNKNLDYYKDKIARSGVFQNAPIVGKDISIPYSSINVKRSDWGLKIILQAFTRIFNYKGTPVNLPFTTFQQYEGYNGSEFRITVDSNTFQKLNSWINSDGSWGQLSQFIVDYQNKNKLFRSIPSILSKSDIEIVNPHIDPINNIIDIEFNLKCLYSKDNLNQQKFILHIYGDNSTPPTLWSSKQVDDATLAPKANLISINDSSDTSGNNMLHWIEPNECSCQIVISFD